MQYYTLDLYVFICWTQRRFRKYVLLSFGLSLTWQQLFLSDKTAKVLQAAPVWNFFKTKANASRKHSETMVSVASIYACALRPGFHLHRTVMTTMLDLHLLPVLLHNFRLFGVLSKICSLWNIYISKDAQIACFRWSVDLRGGVWKHASGSESLLFCVESW